MRKGCSISVVAIGFRGWESTVSGFRVFELYLGLRSPVYFMGEI